MFSLPCSRISSTRTRIPRERTGRLSPEQAECSYSCVYSNSNLLTRCLSREIKSVTIWFQNKRQTERKSAASNSGQTNSFNEQNVHPNVTSAIHTFSLHSNESQTLPSTSPIPTRPSLDRVASRSELRTPSSHTHHSGTHNRPHSPKRISSFPPFHPTPTHHHQKELYDHLPSSPLTSPPHSLARDFIEFGKSSNSRTRRTLEWACEAARIADRDKERDRDRDAVSGSPCCTSAANSVYHRHQSHQNGPHASAEVFATSRMSAHASASASSRGCAPHRTARDQPQQNLRQTHHRKETRELTRERERLARPSSSVTLRAHTRMQVEEGATDSEEEDGHEAITPPSISNRWPARLSKTSTNTSLASSSSTSTTPSTSISREGSTTSTNTSFTSTTSTPDDAMFKAALALCGLGRVGQVHDQYSNQNSRRT